MTGGNGDQRGLTPRIVEEIFGNINKAKGGYDVSGTIPCLKPRREILAKRALFEHLLLCGTIDWPQGLIRNEG